MDVVKTVAEVRQEPYKLPEGFLWGTLNWDDPAVCEEAYVLLRDNYGTLTLTLSFCTHMLHVSGGRRRHVPL